MTASPESHADQGDSAMQGPGNQMRPDSLETAYCPSMAPPKFIVTIDMLVKNSGPRVQAVCMCAKLWTFTATSCPDGTSGCMVTNCLLYPHCA